MAIPGDFRNLGLGSLNPYGEFEMTPEIQTKGVVVCVGERVEELQEGDYVIYQPMHAIRLEEENKEYLLFLVYVVLLVS